MTERDFQDPSLFDVLPVPMSAERAESPFERIKFLDKEGVERWSARQLGEMTGYSKWSYFLPVVVKAIGTCDTHLGVSAGSHHFLQVQKMAPLGSGASRQIPDFHVTRHGAHLIFMEADGTKPMVAEAKAHFSVQTARMDAIDRGDSIEALNTTAILRAMLAMSERMDAEQAAVRVQLAATSEALDATTERLGVVERQTAIVAAKIDHRDPGEESLRLITPTTLGGRMTPMRSNQEVNKLLEAAGLQWWQDGGWTATGKGQEYSHNLPVKAKNGSIRYQLKWHERVVFRLERWVSMHPAEAEAAIASLRSRRKRRS